MTAAVPMLQNSTYIIKLCSIKADNNFCYVNLTRPELSTDELCVY